MNLLYTRATSLSFLVAALACACSSSDENTTPDPGQGEVGGSDVHTGGAATSGGGGGGGIVAGAASSGGSGTAKTVGSSAATGGSTAKASTKAGSGGTGVQSATGFGGNPGSGGTRSTSVGGSTPAGGTAASKATGGSNATGGSRTTGGSSANTKSSGGSSAVGGTRATGGGKATGGTTASSGGALTGGSRATGGLSTTGGSSGSSSGSDGCSDTLALGLTLSEVAVFQSGKISVMRAGAGVAPSTEYGADIVEGRATLFRAYVTVDGGFQSRQLSARLVLNGGATNYYSKQTISASSTELSATNSFAIAVPASDIAAGLNYSIRIVECATGSGTAHNPQFPDSGQASLTTRLAGPLKVTAIAVPANNVTPTLDQNFASNVEAALEAMYPTADAQVTLDPTPITGCSITPSTASDGTTWSRCLDLVRARRSADKPPSDVYYLGIVTPAASLRTYCGNGCIAGISYEATVSGSSSRASLSIGYLPEGLDTMAHELGHAHGLVHSPGCGASSVDANFPHVVSGKSYIGWVGWDNRKPSSFLDPAKVTDIMAYCTPQWVSDYVYSKWEDRVAAINKNPSVMGAAEAGLWRVLSIVGNEVQWGQPVTDPEPPSGEPESATVLDVYGRVIQETTVYKTPIAIDSPEAVTAASYMIPEPAGSWDSVLIGDIVAKF